jgi:ribosomal-protein-alanine N-acetyltransferase
MPLILETNRLVLKQFSMEDAAHLFELNSDPEVVKYTGDGVYTDINEVNQSIARNLEQYEKYKQGRLSVFIKQTGEFIGWCGLRYFPETGKSDLGYRFIKKYWGNGYATEAAKACLDYGFKILDLQEIIATAMKENSASVNVFHKLGLKYSHDEDCGCQPGVVYTITKKEWK